MRKKSPRQAEVRPGGYQSGSRGVSKLSNLARAGIYITAYRGNSSKRRTMPTVKQQPSIFSIEICRLWCKTVRSCTARGSADA